MKIRRFASLLVFISLGFSLSNFAQEENSIHELQQTLEKTTTLNDLWRALAHAQQIPYTAGDSVAFLYRGTAKSVEWMGDFNGWGL